MENRVSNIEDFLKLTEEKEKYEIIKGKTISSEGLLAYSNLEYSSIHEENITRGIERALSGRIYGLPTVSNLDNMIREFYEKYLFLNNIELYIKKGKYGNIFKQLCFSTIPVKGRFKEDNSPLEALKKILLIEEEKTFLESMNERLKNFSVGTKKVSALYQRITDSNKGSFFKVLENNYGVIYQFTVSKKTAKNYYLDRDKLIYSNLDFKELNKPANFIDFFKPFIVNKYELDLEIGDKVMIIQQTIPNLNNEYSHSHYLIKEDNYLKYLQNTVEQNKIIGSCSKKDLENISNYFTQVLSSKTSNDFDSLNAEREAKIKELEEKYYSIPLPTHEDLLKVCNNMNLNPYNEDIPNYESRILASNFERLNSVLNLEKREKIGSKLRELRIQRENSNDTLEEASEFKNLNVSLTKKQKVAAEIIFDKYYSEENKTIEHDFYFDYKRMCMPSEKKDYAKEIIVRRKKGILKTTTCVKSDFDFS